MDTPFEASAASADAAHAATRMREMAQQRIVDTFRRQLDDEGPGPTDDELQSFARLALVEQALHRR
ncbi:hypothetical protein [Variovorax sp. PBL-E5]|uniref:hypothetical protein n=1 Tax=Variovorax sp. PBL-E5 TaxID=434014 RepID=UPI0013184671|nr:hypothetical protein [Variovorax sp. PBL-E5]VTU34778.1 hypothetical protein E5CHR_03895 [Variovorax sp. PBL-E5]